jgi:hypothetical protein
MNVRAMTAGVVTTLFALSAAGAAPTTKSATSEEAFNAPLKLTINGRPEHPTVYLTPADIKQARANRDRYPWPAPRRRSSSRRRTSGRIATKRRSSR